MVGAFGIEIEMIATHIKCLNKGGHLFIEYSEILRGLSHEFKYIEPGVYRKLRINIL